MGSIYLVRHGESEVNLKEDHKKVFTGRNNWSKLTDKGHLQADTVGDYFRFRDLHFDRVFSSPAIRAQETTSDLWSSIEEGWPLYDIDSRLSELGQGKYEGKLKSKIMTPQRRARLKEEGFWRNKVPGGESQEEVFERMKNFFQEEIYGMDDDVLLVSHANAIKCFITGEMKKPSSYAFDQRLSNGSITRLDIENGSIKNLNFNKTLIISGEQYSSSSISDRTKELIERDQFGVLFQVGGFGTRLKSKASKTPKPILGLNENLAKQWPRGDTTLEKLFNATPLGIPIYLHMETTQVDQYNRFLHKNDYFSRNPEDIHFVIQNQTKILDRKGKPFTYGGLDFILASDGQGSFLRNHINFPEYMYITDGSKLGLDFQEVDLALQQLNEKKQRDAFVFVRDLSPEEISREIELAKEKHARYARVDTIKDKPRTYSNISIPQRILSGSDYPALTGEYVISTSRYRTKTSKMSGIKTKQEALAKCLPRLTQNVQGTSRLFKTSMAMQNLDYGCHKSDTYFHAIKYDEDLLK